MTNPEVVLEVIACSVADAIEAEKGGANRLEIVRDLHLGGLTPSFELVSEIQSSVSIPLRVMLRESTGYETNGEDEIERLCDATVRFGSLGVAGFVIGFLKQESIDVELTRRILECAPNVKATFHHAFEDSPDKRRALEQIKSISQIDRILSNGGNDLLSERVQRLARYEQLAAPDVKIIAGGGIDAEAIKQIGQGTGIREFHVGRAARTAMRVDGVVEAECVSKLVQTLRELEQRTQVSDKL